MDLRSSTQHHALGKVCTVNLSRFPDPPFHKESDLHLVGFFLVTDFESPTNCPYGRCGFVLRSSVSVGAGQRLRDRVRVHLGLGCVPPGQESEAPAGDLVPVAALGASRASGSLQHTECCEHQRLAHRMATTRMTTTRGKTFDWETSKPAYDAAWHPVNKHIKIIEKIRPPSPLRPKAAAPTLKELSEQPTSKMRCFNGPVLVDVLRTAQKENSLSHLSQSLNNSKHTASVMDSSVTAGHKSMLRDDAATMRRREIVELQRKEDNESRMEKLRKNIAKQKARKEREFNEAYEKLQDERKNFIERRSDEASEMGVDQYLQNKADAELQKKKALHTEWKECVFKNIQDQLIDRVDTMDAEEISARRRDLFQKYIDAAAAKGGGLFLDIVIENEYDPFTWKKNTLKYRAKPAVVSNGPGFTDRFGNPVFDPVKRDLEKLKSEAKQAEAVGGGGGGLQLAEGEKMGRETLGHEHWSKIEATPFYDRAAKVQDALASGKGPKIRKGTTTNIDLTDYDFPRGPAQTTKELNGLYGKGKKCFTDWQPGRSLYQATS
jgi:hypothetical protein